MRILAVDIGTGTQDILLFDSDLQPENCFKLVVPSPTMRVAAQVKEAGRLGQSLILSGVTMGGGPCHWAVRDHAAAGHQVFATPDAARTFDDDLSRVEAMGIRLISDDEANGLARTHADWLRLDLHDFDYGMISRALNEFGVNLDLDGVAVAVFDHGAAPPDVSDRQFRFDYLDQRIRDHNRLSAFAFEPNQIPDSMTRMQAVATSAKQTGVPDDLRLMVMDTAPAAVLGALLDYELASRPQQIIANVGNFHTLAFRLDEASIQGVFEHHTGHLDTAKLDSLITALANSTLQHEDVFGDHGHGALVYQDQPMPVPQIGVTGPRRSMMLKSQHQPYFAVPFGDMMIAGCFGLVRAWADVFEPDHAIILDTFAASKQVAPWEFL